MRWYKHSTGSHDDPDISDAWDELGDFGYVGFFVILEIYGQEFTHRNNEDFIDISQTFLRRKLRKSSGKVQLLLDFFSKRDRIISKINGDRIMLKVPKFIELADNWGTRKLRSNSVVTTAIEGEEEVEVEEEVNKELDNKEVSSIKVIPPIVPQTGDGGNVKDKPKPKPRKAGIKPKYTELFNEFWNVYPRKGNKSGAFESWTVIGKAQKDLGITMPEIINIVKEQISKGILNLSDDLKHCPLPVTWLNQHRWEDEESVTPQTKSKYPLL